MLLTLNMPKNGSLKQYPNICSTTASFCSGLVTRSCKERDYNTSASLRPAAVAIATEILGLEYVETPLKNRKAFRSAAA